MIFKKKEFLKTKKNLINTKKKVQRRETLQTKADEKKLTFLHLSEAVCVQDLGIKYYLK
jgi:hypothetical protein